MRRYAHRRHQRLRINALPAYRRHAALWFARAALSCRLAGTAHAAVAPSSRCMPRVFCYASRTRRDARSAAKQRLRRLRGDKRAAVTRHRLLRKTRTWHAQRVATAGSAAAPFIWPRNGILLAFAYLRLARQQNCTLSLMLRTGLHGAHLVCRCLLRRAVTRQQCLPRIMLPSLDLFAHHRALRDTRRWFLQCAAGVAPPSCTGSPPRAYIPPSRGLLSHAHTSCQHLIRALRA